MQIAQSEQRSEAIVKPDIGDAHVLLAMCGQAARPLQSYLHAYGLHISLAESAPMIIQQVRANRLHAVVLDARFQRFSYLAIGDALRRERFVYPVLLLLPGRETSAVQRALQHGIDDCLFAPFSPHDLLVRLLVGMHHAHQDQGRPKTNDPLVVSVERHLVTANGIPLHLTRLEFALAAVLTAHAGSVLERQRLAALAWGESWTGDGRLIDSHICRLRNKLKAAGVHPCPIQSVRGIGYRYTPSTSS